MDIIERTKQYLSNSGMAQYQLAKIIGVHPVTLSRFLNRARRASVCGKLDRYLAEQESQGMREGRTAHNG